MAKQAEFKKKYNQKLELPEPEITEAEANAILTTAEKKPANQKHTDIMDAGFAMQFRRMSVSIPQVTRFFKITRSTSGYKDLNGREPYFAVEITDDGVALAKKYAGKNRKDNMSGITP